MVLPQKLPAEKKIKKKLKREIVTKLSKSQNSL